MVRTRWRPWAVKRCSWRRTSTKRTRSASQGASLPSRWRCRSPPASEDQDDVLIGPGDQLILACGTEEESAALSVYLYNDELEQLYVHHDVLLADVPMCVEWVGAAPSGEAASFAAVGTLGPVVELWDLDVLNAVNPAAQLEGHTDAVLGLAWNPAQANVLASASADCSVGLWDLSSARRSASLSPHGASKVQAVAWCPSRPTVLLSGGYDGRAVITDVRAPKGAVALPLGCDAETVRWRSETAVLASNEKGQVLSFDVRAPTKPAWALQAHDKACTGLDWGRDAVTSGLLFTCSLDKSVKVWDVSGNKPSLVVARSSWGGAVFGVQLSAATPFVAVLASEGVDLQVWDFKSAVQHYVAKHQSK